MSAVTRNSVSKQVSFRRCAVAAAVSLMFQSQWGAANPTGAQVVNGAVNITQPNANTLNITNSPGAIINWQGFSIGAGEVTRFIQQSASSAVLNRVVGPDISAIQGQLLSNGRVFLINPAGIVVGPGGMIDTAGFVGSSLSMSNADFLAGKLKFSGDASSGTVINQGWIRTSFGGNVLLAAPSVENSGLIQTPGGELILAAGQKLTVTSLEQGGVQFELQAPTDSVLNIGKLLADGGAVGVFAGSLRHSGEIRANALVRDAGGSIVLQAANDIQIASGSITSAGGKVGGNITIESGSGLARVSGSVVAAGSEGKGGGITITGERVTAADGALLDVSGATGGGQILLGGAYQGANAAVRNATTTFVGNATLRADATQQGDGGRIIVWGNDSTRFYGNLSAQGGAAGGNGGFAEVSGKNNLLFEGTANLGAPKGMLGSLLLDPLDLYVATIGGVDGAGAGSTKTSTLIDEATDFPSSAVTVSPTTLAGIAGNVTLFASRYMRISNDVTLTTAGQSLTATVSKYTAPALPDPNALDVNHTPNRLDIAGNITTNNGSITMNAPLIQAVAISKFATVGGAIALTSGTNLSTSSLTLDAGAGAVTLAVGADTANFMQLSAVTGGTVTANAPSSINLGIVTTGAGALTLSSTSSSISTSNITGTGGTINISAPGSSISTGSITGGGAPVTLAAKTGVFTGIIDTTGAVSLATTAGNINATVNNASKLTATAANSFNSASINIGSTTALNADTVTVNVTDCFSSGSCPGASIDLSATGNLTFGTITANAPATTNNASVFNNSISRSVNLTSNGGSILAASPASLITATDVTFSTQQGSGGGVGTAANAVRVDIERNLNLTANGDFNVIATGSGPTRLNAQLGVAKTGGTYTGTLTRNAGGLTLNASATDTTVTVSNLNATGFTQRLYGQNPFITLNTPNGALVATTVVVPEGDTRPNDLVFPFYNTATLPVSISASGALTVNNYTRQSTGASLPKSTTFSSTSGSITLGNIVASKDTVNVSASGTGSNIGITSLSTANGVTASTSGGDITVGLIDTTSGTGAVSLSAAAATGAIKAQTDGGGLEIIAGGNIFLSGKTIGAAGFMNPLDFAGSAVTLLSTGAAGGAIGFAGAPVIANTQNLTINASSTTTSPTTLGASFNVNTGKTALINLNVTADPQAVGKAGSAAVTTEGGLGVYTINSDGTNFTFNLGTVPTANQFAKGALNFTANSGDVTLGAANMGATGSLSVIARNGSILGGAALNGGGSLTLSAGQSTAGGAVAVNVGNVGALNRPADLSITSGNNGTFTSRAGSVTTGNIEADGVSVTSLKGNIVLGNIGTLTRAGAVSVNSNNIGGTTGAVTLGNVKVATLTINDNQSFNNNLANPITTGNLDATSAVTVATLGMFSAGSVNAGNFVVGTSCFLCTRPQVTTNAITGVSAMSVDGRLTTVNGSITGDPAGSGNLSIGAFPSGGLTITGGSVTAGDGSTIFLYSYGAKPFAFTTINAGAKGTVQIDSPAGIQQTAAGGITANTVAFSATTAAAPINQVVGDGRLGLTGTSVLSVNAGGAVALNPNGSTLTSLDVIKTATPTAAGFSLTGLGGGQTVSLTGAADLTTTVSSPTPLNFTLNYSAGKIILAGTGITTNGGNVNLTNATAIDATVGGVTTGGATGGGSASLSTFGAISTGAINTTPTGKGAGGAISLSGNGVLVNGDLRTGTGGGIITLNSSGAITRGGGAQIVSDNAVSVSLFANAADIGAVGTPLLITSPNVTLSATGFTLGGNAIATLTGTSILNLSGDSGFAVTSATAFNNLTVSTRGTGTGAMALTAPGQTFVFARPTTDLFGGAMTNTFQVVSAAGASPVATATFRASDGDLFVGGAGTSITVPNLTLAAANSIGDVKLQGTAANPLTLSNPTQNIGTSATRDVLVRGVVTLNGAAQNLTANRSITAQAEQGNVVIAGVDQNIISTGFGGGAISFKGGAAASQTVTVTGSNTQLIQSPSNATSAGIRLEGGDGAGSTATILYTGTGQQTVQGGGNVSVVGGVGTNAVAEIRTATGSQFITSESNLDVTGGVGAGAAARIINTGTASQQVGESRLASLFTPRPYQTDNITVAAGAGADAIAEINATGLQQIYVNSGKFIVQAGSGANAFARIDNTATSEQLIGCATYFGGCSGGISTINVLAGAGTGAYARITGVGTQRITSSSAINVTGAATDAAATIMGAGQDIRSGVTTLKAGAGNNANALVQSSTTQNFSGGIALSGGGAAGAAATSQIIATGNQTFSGGGAFNLTGGAGDNSLARITSGGNQSINYGTMALTGGPGAGSLVEITQTLASGIQSINGGNMTLTGGGTLATPVANASATIQGNAQTISAGAVTLTAGAGTAAGTTSDAILRNLSGNQIVSGFGAMTLNGGVQFATAGILNQGAGTQTVSASSIVLQTLATNTASAPVMIQNTPATDQKLTASSGGLSLSNQGAGLISVTSAGAQTVTARFIDVHTAPGATGNSIVSTPGNQWLRTTNGTGSGVGSMRVAALGTGLANIESGASQLIELDYPGQMQGTGLDGRLIVGDIAAAGKSRIGAIDQTIFAKSVLVQTGGPGANTQSEIKSTGRQVMSILNGSLQVLGGAGANSLAQIDPTDQNILVNGSVLVQGGGGANSVAQIVSQGTQTLFTTNGNIDVIGGAGAGANASITSVGVQSLSASGGITATNTPGGGSGTIGGAAPPASSSGASSLSSTPSGNVIALGETQNGVINEADPEGARDQNDPSLRAPVCF